MSLLRFLSLCNLLIFGTIFTKAVNMRLRSEVWEQEVSIENFKFVPDVVKIKPGQSVIWTNNTKILHNVVFDLANKSSYLKRGESYLKIFKEKGVYKYYCEPHRAMGMAGTVIVE